VDLEYIRQQGPRRGTWDSIGKIALTFLTRIQIMEAMPSTWRAPQVTMSLWRSLIFFESRMTPAIWKTVGVVNQHCTVAPGC
jgi:hypothetical protein